MFYKVIKTGQRVRLPSECINFSPDSMTEQNKKQVATFLLKIVQSLIA